ncbi:MAG: hypothetical protein PHQ95_00140 [Candidatus Gracilibacteria bacterium]|nr:hypothetical protein [Candidatus Gracilibacteria bacterium]
MTNNVLIAQNSSYTIKGFTTINDIGNVSETFLNDIARSFKKQGRFKNTLEESINFGGKKFHNYGEHIFMFEYSSLEELNQDMENWKKKFKKKNTLTSETIDGKQVLEPSGYFEFNGKFYLLGLLYQDTNEDDNNENNGIYKGIIINPSKFFEVEDETKKVSGKVDGIL